MSDQKEDRYKIINLLSKDAAGGMYLAEDTMLGRKVVYRHLDANAGEQHSSERAAEMASYAGKLCAFQHPNIITIYDVPIDEGGFSLVTQYVEGDTLAERLTQGPLREIGAYRMAVDLLEALHAAHDAGVFHGALHTGSVKRLARATSGYRCLILDLGLNTLATMVKGEDIHIADPVLLAPELHGEDVEPDESADLFMLGQLCYTALAGGHPFSGRSDEDCAAAHLAGELPPLTDYVPDLKPDFAAWVMKMCAGNRDDRPGSIDEATEALHAFKVHDPDAKAATASVPMATATVPMATATVPMATATVPMATPVVPVAVATVPMATPVGQSQKVPVAVPTAQQSAPTKNQAGFGLTGPQSSVNMAGMGSAGEVADFSAGQGQSNQKMYIIIGALVALIAVGVGLKLLLPSSEKVEEVREFVALDPNVKAHLHDVELVGVKGDRGLVNLDAGKTLDWMVLSGASTGDKKNRMAGKPYRINVTTVGNYQEAKRDIPVFFEMKGKEYAPGVNTSNKLGAKAGDGWSVLLRLPRGHKGSMLVTLYMLQEWCGFDVEVTLPSRRVVSFAVPALDPGVTRIPIEIPNAKGGGFYEIKIKAKDATGDFAMGLNAVHVESR
jgi:hypothetical protein